MTARLIPFAAAHVPVLTDDPTFLASAKAVQEGGPGETLVEGGRLLAAAGLARLWPGVVEGWVIIGPDLTRRQKLLVARTLAKRVPEMLEQEGVRRFQASVRAGYARACHLVEWLGMAPEGLMRGYGQDGSDHIRYAWVR